MSALSSILLAVTLAVGEPGVGRDDDAPGLSLSGCRVLPDEDVIMLQGVRVVISTSDVFPENAVLPSGDDHYWGCWRDGVLRDLYAPDTTMEPEDDMTERTEGGQR